jgi:hypothetical protein
MIRGIDVPSIEISLARRKTPSDGYAESLRDLLNSRTPTSLPPFGPSTAIRKMG